MRRRHIASSLVGLLLITLPTAVWAGAEDEAGAWVQAMAHEHADDSSAASPATEGADTEPIEGEDIVYAQTEQGRDVTGYLARPAGEVKGGILVIHEWWGLNDNIRAMARKLALEGYLALAVDLYGGRVADDPGKARELMSSVMEAPAEAKSNLRQAAEYLGAQGAEQLASIGWCFGGGWSLQTALLLGSDLDAAVIYYGRVVSDPDELASLETPILGHFGELDRGIPVESVRAFESALEGLEKPATIHVYPDADHAFANPSGERYQPEAAALAWERTLAFLAEHLG